MQIPFSKMHGAGNDFILVDDREGLFPISDQPWLQIIAARKTGIGCDGFILLQQSQTDADFRMRFLNPDGNEVKMCGNGARCIARFASKLGIVGEEMRFETKAGIIQATGTTDEVTIRLTAPTDWQLNSGLEVFGNTQEYHSVNTGVPHVVIQINNLSSLDIQRFGSAIRFHEAFAPMGTNVDFIQVSGDNSIFIRTYERGVESETLACGTGMVAAALVMARIGQVTSPVTLRPISGDILTVSFNQDKDTANQVSLTGPSVHVFDGVLVYST